MLIETADHRYGHNPEQHDERTLIMDHHVRMHRNNYEVVGHPQGFSKAAKAYARVDHGRWLADCPNEFCNAATVVSKLDRRYFCCVCDNQAWDGKWIEVVFPKEHEAIDAELLRRPHSSLMHWWPGEKVKDLKRESDEQPWTKKPAMPTIEIGEDGREIRKAPVGKVGNIPDKRERPFGYPPFGFPEDPTNPAK